MAICAHWCCNESEGGGERKEKKKNHPSGLPSNPRPQSLFVCMSLDSSNLVSASGLFDLVSPLAVAVCVTLWMMKTGSGGGGGGYIFQDCRNEPGTNKLYSVVCLLS